MLLPAKADMIRYMETIRLIEESLGLEPVADPKQLPALTLAYIGDTVYDLYTRTYLAHENRGTVHALHLESAKYVCAKGQADAFFRIQPMLNEEELAAFRRGRNAHSGTVPKNANVQDYRVATGLEALIGYLYCLGQDERIGALMRAALQKEE